MHQKRPLKKHMVGYEIELFTTNGSGHIIDGADRVLEKIRPKRYFTIKKECAVNMIEIDSNPNEMVPSAMKHMIMGLEHLMDVAEKEGVFLYPLGTYPGNFQPYMREDRPYKIKESIFGKKRFSIAGKCTGFHCHYTLPKGMFDSSQKVLRVFRNSKIKQNLVDSYNFLIAADPALTCFMQSSPYYQGKRMGKDSRVIMYRGGEHLDNKSGLYAKFQEFGGLQSYRQTTFDIMDIVTLKHDRWGSYIKKLGLSITALSLYGSVLDTAWNPVKVNPNGTLEQRGMDMNYPLHIAGVSTMIKFALKSLNEEYTAVPSEIGIKEPFKTEGGVVYIPPHTHVRKELQKRSAYSGLDDDMVHDYCRRFLRFAQSTIPKDMFRFISPFREMLSERKTVSDEIIAYMKKKGFSKPDRITNDAAAEFAVKSYDKLTENIELTKKAISRIGA